MIGTNANSTPSINITSVMRKLLCSIMTIEREETQSLLPLLPPPLLVESVGTGVTSSILPILRPFLARALIADWAPGPGVFELTPPLALNLMWTALIPTSLRALQTSTEASIAKE